jgi:hypothetical protein
MASAPTASTEARRAAVRAFAEEYMRTQAEKKEAGELRRFLESVGWSSDMAIRITEGLEMYDVAGLRFLIREDLEELGLSEDDKLKLLRLAATARDCVQEMSQQQSMQQSMQQSTQQSTNMYLVTSSGAVLG